MPVFIFIFFKIFFFARFVGVKRGLVSGMRGHSWGCGYDRRLYTCGIYVIVKLDGNLDMYYFNSRRWFFASAKLDYTIELHWVRLCKYICIIS